MCCFCIFFWFIWVEIYSALQKNHPNTKKLEIVCLFLLSIWFSSSSSFWPFLFVFVFFLSIFVFYPTVFFLTVYIFFTFSFCLFCFLSDRLVDSIGNGYGQPSRYLVTALKQPSLFITHPHILSLCNVAMLLNFKDTKKLIFHKCSSFKPPFRIVLRVLSSF